MWFQWIFYSLNNKCGQLPPLYNLVIQCIFQLEITYIYFIYFGCGLDTRLVALSSREYELLILYVEFDEAHAAASSILSKSILSDIDTRSVLLFDGTNREGRTMDFFELLSIKRGLLKIDVCNGNEI